MSDRAPFAVLEVSWQESQLALQAIRKTVFIIEQNVPEELEWDGLDAQCLHLLATDSQGQPIGCARFLDDGHIGRMAVASEWRGRGVGAALLRALLDIARRQSHAEVFLNAQTYAVGFYEKYGFERLGDEFLDAGIPHFKMRCRLKIA